MFAYQENLLGKFQEKIPSIFHLISFLSVSTMSNDTSGHPEVNDESLLRPWAVLISTSKLDDVSQCQCTT